MSCDELHNEREIVVRSIVEVHWQTIVFLVERELQIVLGATGANVLPSFEAAYPSIPCRVFTCHMCMMSHLGEISRESPSMISAISLLTSFLWQKGHMVVER